jgi:hypothetical protein
MTCKSVKLTEGEKLRARRLRAAGWSWDAIGEAMCESWVTIRSAVQPEWGEAYRAKKRRASKKSHDRYKKSRLAERKMPAGAGLKNQQPGKSLEIPQSVLLDRERRLELAPRDITAALMGDPIPGRSALDRRQSR